MTGCGAKSPTFYRAQDPAIQSQHPTAHVVLVRLVSRETTTSKQHRAQLISTQTFSGQVHFEWERLTPTGKSSRRCASLCAWVRGQPGEQQGERAWGGSDEAEEHPLPARVEWVLAACWSSPLLGHEGVHTPWF